jgi:hypothetical protein
VTMATFPVSFRTSILLVALADHFDDYLNV